MAKKKKVKNTLAADVKRLVKFKHSIGQEASYKELYKHYKSKGRTKLDARSFRISDQKGRFTSVIDYSDPAVQEILSQAKTKREEKQSKSDLREVYNKAISEVYKRRKKKDKNITFRDVVNEAKSKNIFEVDEDSRPVYRAVSNLLELKYKDNPDLKIIITGSDGKTKSFVGKKGFHEAQDFQSSELSKAWKIVRDSMKQELNDEVRELDFNLEQKELIMANEMSLRKEGKMGVYDDEGEFMRAVKLDLSRQVKFLRGIENDINEIKDEQNQAKKRSRTPLQKIPVTTVTDLEGNPIAVKVNYNDIRGGST